MCYAIPAKIVEIKGDEAVLDYGGIRKNASIRLIDNPKKGDYVLVHAGFAIEKLKKQDAKETLKLIEEMMSGGKK